MSDALDNIDNIMNESDSIANVFAAMNTKVAANSGGDYKLPEFGVPLACEVTKVEMGKCGPTAKNPGAPLLKVFAKSEDEANVLLNVLFTADSAILASLLESMGLADENGTPLISAPNDLNGGTFYAVFKPNNYKDSSGNEKTSASVKTYLTAEKYEELRG